MRALFFFFKRSIAPCLLISLTRSPASLPSAAQELPRAPVLHEPGRGRRLRVRGVSTQDRPVHSRDANSGGQGGHPAPLTSRLYRIPTHFLLSLHGI